MNKLQSKVFVHDRFLIFNIRSNKSMNTSCCIMSNNCLKLNCSFYKYHLIVSDFNVPTENLRQLTNISRRNSQV